MLIMQLFILSEQIFQSKFLQLNYTTYNTHISDLMINQNFISAIFAYYFSMKTIALSYINYICTFKIKIIIINSLKVCISI